MGDIDMYPFSIVDGPAVTQVGMTLDTTEFLLSIPLGTNHLLDFQVVSKVLTPYRLVDAQCINKETWRLGLLLCFAWSMIKINSTLTIISQGA
jgi:hypothetical protein